jgi:hypothetical protein
MIRIRSPWLVAAFLAGFLAVGLPYWQIPYNKVNLPDAVMGLGLLVIVAASAVARAGGRIPIFKTTLVVGAAVPAAVFARVIVEGMKDPTSHNLWPFEVVIALVVGLGASVIGTLLGSALLLFPGKDSTMNADDQ